MMLLFAKSAIEPKPPSNICKTVDSSNLPIEHYPPITEKGITVQEVISVIKKLNPNKANGDDNISNRILKETREEIAPSLCTLFNKSIRQEKYLVE